MKSLPKGLLAVDHSWQVPERTRIPTNPTSLKLAGRTAANRNPLSLGELGIQNGPFRILHKVSIALLRCVGTSFESMGTNSSSCGCVHANYPWISIISALQHGLKLDQVCKPVLNTAMIVRSTVG